MYHKIFLRKTFLARLHPVSYTHLCTDHDATVCDPACGSGSLLIRALEEAPFESSGYGQEKDGSTAGLAKMNAVLHNKACLLYTSCWWACLWSKTILIRIP